MRHETMEKYIKEELQNLQDKYYKQQNIYSLDHEELYDHGSFLEYQLLGVATFVKSLAYKTDNTELLGIASKMEIDVLADIEKETDSEQHHEFSEQFEFYEHARKLCIKLFYKENRYQVNMNEFLDILNKNKEVLQSAGFLEQLEKYINEENVLKKIYYLYSVYSHNTSN